VYVAIFRLVQQIAGFVTMLYTNGTKMQNRFCA